MQYCTFTVNFTTSYTVGAFAGLVKGISTNQIVDIQSTTVSGLLNSTEAGCSLLLGDVSGADVSVSDCSVNVSFSSKQDSSIFVTSCSGSSVNFTDLTLTVKASVIGGGQFGGAFSSSVLTWQRAHLHIDVSVAGSYSKSGILAGSYTGQQSPHFENSELNGSVYFSDAGSSGIIGYMQDSFGDFNNSNFSIQKLNTNGATSKFGFIGESKNNDISFQNCKIGILLNAYNNVGIIGEANGGRFNSYAI